MDIPVEVKARVRAQRIQMLQSQYYDLSLQQVMYNASGASDKAAQLEQQKQIIETRYNALIAVEVEE